MNITTATIYSNNNCQGGLPVVQRRRADKIQCIRVLDLLDKFKTYVYSLLF